MEWTAKFSGRQSIIYLVVQNCHQRMPYVPGAAEKEKCRKLQKADQHFDPNKLEWKLQLAIQQLPDKQRVVFGLRYYDEMPYEEMSRVLETSEGALKASYHHAVKKIEDYMLNH